MTKRESILEAAEELFAENGFDATSVRELAQKAGVNIAMISYYFGSKEKLFEALVDYRVSFMRDRLDDLRKLDISPMEKIDRLIDLYVERIFSHVRFHRILHRQISLQNRSDLNTNIFPYLMRNAEAVGSIIQEGVDKKAFREVDVELLIVSITGTISKLTLSNFYCTRFMHTDESGSDTYSGPLKTRVQNYLKDLTKRYLQP